MDKNYQFVLQIVPYVFQIIKKVIWRFLLNASQTNVSCLKNIKTGPEKKNSDK